MNSPPSYPCAIISIVVLFSGVPAVAVADGGGANDVALDLSLPADFPLIQNSPMEHRVPIEPLGTPAPSRFDLPMLGSALDLSVAPQVGEAHDADE